MIGRQAPGETADTVACPGGKLPGAQRLVAAVLPPALHRAQRVAVKLEAVGHAGRDVDDRAYRTAAIGRRERSVKHIDAADVLRSGNAEMRAGAAVIVANGRIDHDPVDKDQVACRCPYARSAGGDRVLGVAEMAFADHQRGRIAQHVLGVDGVDLFGGLGRADLDIGRGGVFLHAVGGDDDEFRAQAAAHVERLRILGVGRHGDKRDKRCACAKTRQKKRMDGHADRHESSPGMMTHERRGGQARAAIERLRRSGVVRGPIRA